MLLGFIAVVSSYLGEHTSRRSVFTYSPLSLIVAASPTLVFVFIIMSPLSTHRRRLLYLLLYRRLRRSSQPSMSLSLIVVVPMTPSLLCRRLSSCTSLVAALLLYSLLLRHRSLSCLSQHRWCLCRFIAEVFALHIVVVFVSHRLLLYCRHC